MQIRENYVLHDLNGEERVSTEALSTHKDLAPKISTMKATVRMPLYDRVNGLLEQNHCYPFMTYMLTNRSIFADSKDTFYIIEIYVSQDTLHSCIEGQSMCLFSRDHLSPTLAFDNNYDFSDQELGLQRMYQLSLLNDSTITIPLEKYNFSPGFLWDYWVICDVKKLLENLETTTPETWSTRFLFNWSSYTGKLAFDIKIGLKNRLLRAMYLQGCLPDVNSCRTMDQLRGSEESQEFYKNIPTVELKNAVTKWRTEANTADVDMST